MLVCLKVTLATKVYAHISSLEPMEGEWKSSRKSRRSFARPVIPEPRAFAADVIRHRARDVTSPIPVFLCSISPCITECGGTGETRGQDDALGSLERIYGSVSVGTRETRPEAQDG